MKRVLLRKLSIFFFGILFAVFSFTILLAPIFAQGLEVNYPEVPSVPVGHYITTTQSVIGYVKYLFNLSIIIGAIVAFGSLVYGGFLYLSSTGETTKIREAKKQITASFLGLIILLTSFFVLKTINPRLVFLKIEKPTTTAPAILLSNSSSTLRVETSIPNLKKFAPTHYKYEAERGLLRGIVYASTSYASTSLVLPYTTTTTAIPTTVSPIANNPFTLHLNAVRSIAIQRLGLGVFLYGTQVCGKLLSRVFGPIVSSIPSLENKILGQGVKYLRIQNNKPGQTTSSKNFLVIAFENPKYQGTAKIFFQKQTFSPPSKFFPCSGSSYTCGNVTSSEDKVNVVENDEYGALAARDLTSQLIIRGNQVTTYNCYDKVAVVSSLKIFNLNPKPTATCTVTLYTHPNLNATTSNANAASEKCVINKYILEPRNIDSTELCGREWDNKVRSMSISGNCAIVLFENKMKKITTPPPSFWVDNNGLQSYTGTVNVFTHTINDLGDYTIGQCYNTWAQDFSQPCASSIAIYPIKGPEL